MSKPRLSRCSKFCRVRTLRSTEDRFFSEPEPLWPDSPLRSASEHSQFITMEIFLVQTTVLHTLRREYTPECRSYALRSGIGGFQRLRRLPLFNSRHPVWRCPVDCSEALRRLATVAGLRQVWPISLWCWSGDIVQKCQEVSVHPWTCNHARL